MSVKKEKVRVYDMTCNTCESRVERALKKLDGVLDAKASFRAQQVIVEYDNELCDIGKIKESIKSAGYSTENSNVIKVIGLIIVAAAIILLSSSTGGFDMNARLNGASYFVLFIVGVLTSIHCVGMCGGIMLSQSMSKENTTKFQAILPAVQYNAGRVVAYTVIGGIVGALGSVLSLSLTVKAALQMFAGVFMIIMGLNMAGFSMFRKLNIKLPWSACSVKGRPKTPFLVGLLNGLMPCGPLQTMQLYALGTGSAFKGALSMFLFSLGTVPLMLTFGALSGLLSKGYTKKMLKMSGFLVIILGLIMGNRGLALAGIGVPDIADLRSVLFTDSSSQSSLNKAVLKEGVQEITMTVDGSGFTPNVFYVKKNVPLKWVVKGNEINPCNYSIVVPAFNKRLTVEKGDNVIELTPGDKNINFSCWMGMIKGTIKVTDNLNSVDTSEAAPEEEEKAPSIYGDDLSLVATERLVKKAELSGNVQTVKIRGIGYEFEPMIVIVNKGVNTNITLDLRAFDDAEDKFEIVDSTTKEKLNSFNGLKGIVSREVIFKKTGTFTLINSKNVLTVIVIVDDITKVDMEKIRSEYLSKN